MGTRRCCIKDCVSGNGTNRRVSFKIPEDNKQEWMNVISPHLSKGAHNRKHFYVCDLHFKEGDVQYYYEVKCADGSLFKEKRGLPKLNVGCVPCIFDRAETKSVFGNEPQPSTTASILNSSASNSCKGQNTETVAETITSSADFVYSEVVGTSEGISESDPLPSMTCNKPTIQYDFKSMSEELNKLRDSNKLPKNWSCTETPIGLFSWYYGGKNAFSKAIFIGLDMKLQVRVNGFPATVDVASVVTRVDDVTNAMSKISRLSCCQGVDENTRCKKGLFEAVRLTSSMNERCLECRIKRKANQNNQNKKRKRSILKSVEQKRVIKNLKRKVQRMDSNFEKCMKNIEALKEESAKLSEEAVMKAVEKMPLAQQQAVKACLDSAKRKGPNESRYTHHWILRCILIRTKNKMLYDHLRKYQIMQLPTVGTLNKYIRNMIPAYGFRLSTF